MNLNDEIIVHLLINLEYNVFDFWLHKYSKKSLTTFPSPYIFNITTKLDIINIPLPILPSIGCSTELQHYHLVSQEKKKKIPYHHVNTHPFYMCLWCVGSAVNPPRHLTCNTSQSVNHHHYSKSWIKNPWQLLNEYKTPQFNQIIVSQYAGTVTKF